MAKVGRDSQKQALVARAGQLGDHLSALGTLALSARMKRLSDMMVREAHVLYRELELGIEPNWYLVFLLLEEHKTLSVTEIRDGDRVEPSLRRVVDPRDAEGGLCGSGGRRERWPSHAPQALSAWARAAQGGASDLGCFAPRNRGAACRVGR